MPPSINVDAASLVAVALMAVALIVILLATVVLPWFYHLALLLRFRSKRSRLLDTIHETRDLINEEAFRAEVESVDPRGTIPEVRQATRELGVIAQQLDRAVSEGINNRIPSSPLRDNSAWLEERLKKLTARAGSAIGRYDRMIDLERTQGYMHEPSELAHNWERRIQSVQTMLKQNQMVAADGAIDLFHDQLDDLVDAAEVLQRAITMFDELEARVDKIQETTGHAAVSYEAISGVAHTLAEAASAWRMHQNARAVDLAGDVIVEVEEYLTKLKKSFPGIAQDTPAEGIREAQ